MDRRELDRYERALLAKRDELSVEDADARRSPIPVAGGWEDDPLDQANADAEEELPPASPPPPGL